MKIIPVIATLLFTPLTFASDGKKHDAGTVQAACGDDHIQLSARRSDAPSQTTHLADKATVYVFSKLNYGGIPIGCQVVSRVGLDGKWVGANCGTSYTVASVDPGQHHLCADWQSRVMFGNRPRPALLGLDVAAGKSYYFLATIVFQEGLTDLTLQAIDEDQGKNLLSSSSVSESKFKH